MSNCLNCDLFDLNDFLMIFQFYKITLKIMIGGWKSYPPACRQAGQFNHKAKGFPLGKNHSSDN
jgi:hypothetical protein